MRIGAPILKALVTQKKSTLLAWRQYISKKIFLRRKVQTTIFFHYVQLDFIKWLFIKSSDDFCIWRILQGMLNREILAKTISRKVFYLNGNPNRKPTTNPLSLLMTYHLLWLLMDFLAQELQKLEMPFSITMGKNFPQKTRVVSKPV